MQGLESLNQFQKFVSSLGGLGRYGDTYMIHAEEGETVVPMEVLDRNPVLKKRLFKSMKALGIDPGRYIVGNDLNSLNPVTGQPEFFLKKIVSQIRKALPGDTEQYLGPIAGLLTGNPLLGAIAGGVGGGVPGAIAGGGAGYFSPGLSAVQNLPGLGWARNLPFAKQTGAGGLMELLRGSGQVVGSKGPMMPTKGIFGEGGKFGFGEGTIADAVRNYMGFDKTKGSGFDKEILMKGLETGAINEDNIGDFIGEMSKDNKISLTQMLKAGIPLTIAFGMLIKGTTPEGPVGMPLEELPTGVPYQGILNPQLTYANPNYREGGILDLQGGGESRGPGTGTSDSIPAMLSDGEFVMTADAVRGAGGGDRREGARRMYEAMDRLEARA